MEGAWIIWERSIIPTLLSRCGSWIGISKKIYKKIDEIQEKYLRMIYSCPPTTPKPALRSHAGMFDAKHRIWVEKDCVLADILHNNQMKVKNYFCFQRNRKGVKSMGDVATLVAKEVKGQALRVTEGENDDEFLLIRLGHVEPAVNIRQNSTWW